ncbi:MAG: hypothetical protein JO257_33810 [Deltaproteobacteria bacterium]|nr:hypothetical protein [Deltaproteobacteria bacterium]
MSARSLLRSVALVAAVAACKSPPKAPEADPAGVKALAAQMANNIPAPQAARLCQPADYANIPTLTYVTLLRLADLPVKEDPQHADWINPPQLESPAIHDVTGTDETARRRAAAQLLAAPGWLVYKVDMMNAPMAIGVKELKIGTIGARAIRFDKRGLPVCVEVFYFQNDQQKSDYAISKSDRAYIDPELAKMLREDLAAQYLTHAPKAPPPATK